MLKFLVQKLQFSNIQGGSFVFLEFHIALKSDRQNSEKTVNLMKNCRPKMTNRQTSRGKFEC